MRLTDKEKVAIIFSPDFRTVVRVRSIGRMIDWKLFANALKGGIRHVSY